MLSKKKIAFLVNTLVILFFSTQIVYSACLSEPSYISIRSGTDNLGIFDPNDDIAINPNLNSDPLRIQFVFENTNANCFSAKEDMELKLFSTGTQLPADSYNTQNSSGEYTTTFTFLKQVNIEVTNPFISTYEITSAGNSLSSGQLLFSPDTAAPIFDVFSFQPTDPLLSGNQEIRINYQISDSGSGLDLITVSKGSSNELITFDSRNETYSGSVIENLDSTTTYTISARDNLGQVSNFETVTFVVDSEGPQIVDVEKSYDYDVTRRVSFSVELDDVSFLYGNNPPSITGDFSLINPSFSSYTGNCLRLTNSSYRCSFNDIEITEIESTENIFVVFNSTDSLGNTRTQSFTEEIYVDNLGPEITEFKVVNSLGVENIFSSFDDEVKVYLKFKDSSIEFGEPRLFYDFDLVMFPTGNCTYTSNTGTCVWTLGNISSLYSEIESDELTFGIQVVDFYSNSVTETIPVSLDNNFPILTTIELIETETIKDGIVKSGERINYRVFIEDENLVYGGEYFVRGDFSQIDFRDSQDDVEGLCSSYNTNTIQCDFNGIVVENGYMLRNITFTISDTASNEIEINEEIEIFQVSNEVFSSYRIKDIGVLNPLNRNSMLSSGGVGWFEGKLELVSGTDIEIVNYELVSCAEEEMDPLLVIDYELFPDEVVVNVGQDDIDEFAMKVEIKDHNNVNDLNDKRMTCILSVLKRDSETVYSPELVEFELLFSFYDIPRGNLLNAHAENILSMYDEIEFLGEWFDGVYGFYSLFDGVCNTVLGAGNLLSAVGNVVYGVQWLITTGGGGTPAANSMAGKIGSAAYKPQAIFGQGLFGQDSWVKKTCDWVTCRNGAHFTGLLSGGLDSGNTDYGLGNVPGLGDLIDGYNNLCVQGAVQVFGEGERESNE